MTIAASRPARALRGGMLALTVALAWRWPAIDHAFQAALAAATTDDLAVEQHLALAEVSAKFALVRRPTNGVQRIVHRSSNRRPLARVGKRVLLASQPVARAVDQTETPSIASSGAPRPVTQAAAPGNGDAGALATAAYARLAAGDRRGAVRLFDAALAGDDPRRPLWQRQRDTLTRHWSGSAYTIVRDAGPAGLALEPVLGGSQSGATIAYAPEPLSSRPIAATLRGSLAHDDHGRSAFVAVGLNWHPVAGVTLAAERLIAVGPAGPNAWTVRLAAGTDRTIGRWRTTLYGEGGVIGHADYAAVQGRAALAIPAGRLVLEPGIGGWSSIQHDRGATVDRADLGPGVVGRAGPFTAEVDYRIRVAGNAAPGSGPVLTLSAAF